MTKVTTHYEAGEVPRFAHRNLAGEWISCRWFNTALDLFRHREEQAEHGYRTTEARV